MRFTKWTVNFLCSYSCSIFPNLACSLSTESRKSRFILRFAHLFCFHLCFGFGGGFIVFIAVVIICCSFGLRLRFSFRCLGKLEKLKQRCGLCMFMQPDHYGADWFLIIVAVVVIICGSLGLCLRFGFGLWGLRKSRNN